MNILITGVSGFLGSSLAELLLSKYTIVGIKGPSNTSVKIGGIKIYDNNIGSIIEKPEIVIMCHAAVSSGNSVVDNESLFKANVKFTEQVINLFPNSYHLYISSVSVYGLEERLINESSHLNPETGYAVSKVWGEKIAQSKIGSGILRLSSLYGPGMKNGTLIANYVDQALNIGKIQVWGNGERKQNYLHVEDAVLYIESMFKKRQEGICIASSQREISNKELANIINSITGAPIEYSDTDNSASRYINNEISRNRLEIKREKDLTEGIKDYILWKKRRF